MPRKTQAKKTRYPGLYRFPSGKWQIRVYATDERTGRRREIRRVLDADVREAEAVAVIHQLKADIQVGDAQSLARQRTCLTDYAEQWLKGKASRLRVSTANHYATTLANRILPSLGDLFVDAIDRRDVERWVAWAERSTTKQGQPYSRHTISGWWRVLTQLLRDACADFGVTDPTVRVRAPRGRGRRRREKRTLTGPELSRFLDVVKRDYPERHAEVYTLAFTGMRPGELYALVWDDVEDARRRIHIRRSHRHGVVTETKTGDPREVALTPAIAEVLRAHRRSLVVSQHPGLESGLVFPSKRGGHRGPESLHKPLARASETAELEVRVGPQVLRRTFNTLMVQAGVDRIVLRAQMGHCSEEMTERYAGVGVESKLEAVRRLEKMTS